MKQLNKYVTLVVMSVCITEGRITAGLVSSSDMDVSEEEQNFANDLSYYLNETNLFTDFFLLRVQMILLDMFTQLEPTDVVDGIKVGDAMEQSIKMLYQVTGVGLAFDGRAVTCENIEPDLSMIGNYENNMKYIAEVLTSIIHYPKLINLIIAITNVNNSLNKIYKMSFMTYLTYNRKGKSSTGELYDDLYKSFALSTLRSLEEVFETESYRLIEEFVKDAYLHEMSSAYSDYVHYSMDMAVKAIPCITDKTDIVDDLQLSEKVSNQELARVIKNAYRSYEDFISTYMDVDDYLEDTLQKITEMKEEQDSSNYEE